jgi:phosphoribosylformylglycinamidine synthase
LIARVVVVPKPVVNDPQGVTVRQGLNALGFAEVTDVRVGKYIEVSVGGESAEEVHARVDQMCRRLLANQVIEDYRFELDAPSAVSPSTETPSPSEGEGRGGGAK